MKKNFKIEDLCCATCAAKIEDKINKLDKVISANLNFMAEKLTVEAEEQDFDSIMPEIRKIIKKIEPDCSLIEI